MAKLSVKLRNEKRKKMAAKQKPTRLALKAIVNNVSLDYEVRMDAQQKLQALPRNGAPSRVASRCVMTGRVRGVYRKFGLSRIKFRELALEGKIPGVIKASW